MDLGVLVDMALFLVVVYLLVPGIVLALYFGRRNVDGGAAGSMSSKPQGGYINQ